MRLNDTNEPCSICLFPRWGVNLLNSSPSPFKSIDGDMASIAANAAENLGPRTLGFAIVTYVLAAFTTAGRFLNKKRSREGFWWDDWLSLFGMVHPRYPVVDVTNATIANCMKLGCTALLITIIVGEYSKRSICSPSSRGNSSARAGIGETLATRGASGVRHLLEDIVCHGAGLRDNPQLHEILLAGFLLAKNTGAGHPSTYLHHCGLGLWLDGL